jgi:diguanylate cyclase (GGDEF)-like protein
MRHSRTPRDVWASLLPIAGAALALAGAAVVPAARPVSDISMPPGAPDASALLLLLIVTGTAAACHRPRLGGATLSLGTIALPAALALAGLLPGALLAGLGLLGAELLQRAVRLHPAVQLPEKRRFLRALESAGRAALAAFAAGGVWLAAGPRWSLPAVAAAAWAAYTLVWIGLEIADRKVRRPDLALPWRALLVPFALDAAGWIAGTAALAAGTAAGWLASGLLLAGLAALALEAARNALLAEIAERRIDDLERVRRAGATLIESGQEMTAVAEQIRTECRDVLPFHWFQLELLAPGRPAKSWWAGPSGPLADGEPQPGRYAPFLPGVHRRTAWRILELPLRCDGQQVARLRLWCDPRRLHPEEERLLERLLPQMGASIHRSLLDREAREDPLTGVAVRRVLERRLHEVHARCVEEGGPMAVVMCDIDFFKRINDSWGHAAGDQALVAVAAVLDGSRRDTDLCCRYGGEEFTLLLDRTDGETALAIAERLRQNVETLEFQVDGKRVPLTMSAGVACFPQLWVRTAAELLLFADGALYEAKRRGRNRCLLDLGQGRYLDPQGGVETAEDVQAPAEPPRIFA